MLKYRPDIDGLRAIAVASVVLYHLQESLLPGGFVGVDIFFVISGYLITKLIFSELSETDSFSFKRFYLRRIRRLFPALLATLLLSVVLAYALFSPAHLVEFAQSLIAAIFSLSNFFFWSITGYFDSDSSLKPLLHTWSLSVEEQFYFIWPALLVGLFSLKKKVFIPTFILIMGAASLLLNIAVFSESLSLGSWFANEEADTVFDVQSTAFYWLPFRVFEFSIGAILVWLGTANRRSLAAATFALGLGMVLASLLILNSKMHFPSAAALLPCVGAALMIYSGSDHRLSWIVANRAMVGVGLISYSLYLIHWPLIVFYKYSIGREFFSSELVTLLIASVVLAYVMYRFIEQPFRKPKTGKASPNRKFLIGSAITAFATVVISANAISSQGWLWRYPADVVAQLTYKKGDYTEFFWANLKKLEVGFENNGKPKVLVIGDSMAADLVNVLAAANASKKIDIATIAIGENCKSLFGLSDQIYKWLYGGAANACQRQHANALAKDELIKSADTVVLASYLWDENQVEFIPSSVSHLKQITNAQMMVLGLKVQANNGIWFLNKHAFSPHAHGLRTPPHPKTNTINDELRLQAKDYLYFDLLDRFCNADGCQRITKDGYAIIFDESHLSENGAEFLAKSIQSTSWFEQLLTRKP